VLRRYFGSPRWPGNATASSLALLSTIRARRRIVCVGDKAGAGDEAEFCLFPEPSVRVAGVDLKAFGEPEPFLPGFGGCRAGSLPDSAGQIAWLHVEEGSIVRDRSVPSACRQPDAAAPAWGEQDVLRKECIEIEYVET
jgi:hypothetical protein